jgi:DNA-directed RNA polymerase II subunit RPB4
MSHVQQLLEPEEDASQLKFPKEFEKAEPLLISQVNMLMIERKEMNEANDEEKELPKVFLKTLDYCDHFKKFQNNDTIIAVRK